MKTPKRRELNAATAKQAGFTPPNPPKAKTGGGYPHKQPFKRSKR